MKLATNDSCMQDINDTMTGNIGYILYQKSISDAISGLSIQPRTVKLNLGKCKRGHRNIFVSQKNALYTWAHRKGIPI